MFAAVRYDVAVGTHLRQRLRELSGARRRFGYRRLGYEYAGQPYKSLSAIARAITGTRWNGRVFFGLRSSRGLAA